MDRLATAILIAIAALVMNGSLVRDVLAEGTQRLAPLNSVAQSSLPLPTGTAPRSGRVLSLLLTLEALRASPDLADPPKV